MSNVSKHLVAVIPARSSSKRVPRKNTREFFGHPLIAYTIAAAINSNLFTHVIVSTDSRNISEIAESYGAEALGRPKELAGDSISVADATIHAVEQLQSAGFVSEAVCQLLPNCPLRRSEDIAEQYIQFARSGWKFSISSVPYRSGYPQWALAKSYNAEGRWLFGREHLVNSQQLEAAYCPTGAVWWARTPDLLQQRTFYGTPFHVAVMDPNRGLDLDTEEDFRLAEIIVRGLWARDGVSPLEPVNVLASAHGAARV